MFSKFILRDRYWHCKESRPPCNKGTKSLSTPNPSFGTRGLFYKETIILNKFIKMITTERHSNPIIMNSSI